MKIAFTTLGCKLNYAETSTYERGFAAAQWEIVPWKEAADVYLVNTCAVTETAEKKSRNLIRRAHRTAPQARIIVTGCYAEIHKQALEQMEGVWKVYGAADKAQIVPETLAGVGAVSRDAASRPLPSSMGPSLLHGRGWGPRKAMAFWGTPGWPWSLDTAPTPAYTSGVLPAYSSGERTRSFLKVQDGCDNFCAYCTVPFARGRSRNLPIADLTRQAGEIAAQGVKEIVLTGVNTGDFGRTTGESFLDLLKALNEVEGIERWRISSIEPNLITPEIIDWIASGTRFQPHFHIPLQSGSDVLLRKVGRRYDTALFASRIERIRQAMEGPGKPRVFFGIDVIVGLPGESEDLFQETFHFLEERIRPAYLHVFPYSRRPGTRAAEWPDQIPETVKAERVARLEALSDRLHAAFLCENKGVKERVLWESSVRGGKMGGYTGNYIRLEANADPLKFNTLEEVIL